MCLNIKFLVICLIVYAIFQIFQVYSSFVTVFITYADYYDVKIKRLTVFHIIGLTTSSVLLISGAVKLKANFLIGALIYLFYKLGFIVWHFEAFYNISFGCRESAKESSCDPNRLSIIYKHILITGLLTYSLIT